MATAMIFPEAESAIGKPLDELLLYLVMKNGERKLIPALAKFLKEDRTYVHFKNPPSSSNDTETASLFTKEEEDWLEIAHAVVKDLNWVLELPYKTFWCQIIFDEKFHECLVSYTSQAPRPYEIFDLHLKEEILTVLKKVHKVVFKLYLRMSTYKESKEHPLTPRAFGYLIYEYFLFDMPIIMDLCSLYGEEKRILPKMVENIFYNQEKYNRDLNETIQDVLEAISSVEQTLSTENLQDLQTSSSARQVNRVNRVANLTLSSFHDLIMFITDISFTLHSFFEVYPPACQIFYNNGVAARIAMLFDHAFPAIEREVLKRSNQNENIRLMEEMKKNISLSKTLLVKDFRSIINYCCIQKIINSDTLEQPRRRKNPYAEQYLNTLMNISRQKNFLHYYNNLYPLEKDIEGFYKMGVVLDEERLRDIFSCIHDIVDKVPESPTSSIVNGARPKIKPVDSQVNSKTLQNSVDILKGDNLDPRGLEVSLVDAKLSSLIQNVLDIFPELGGGFIEKCLEYLQYNHERVIDSILTDSLPDILNGLDRNLKRNKNPLTYETLTKNPESAFLKQLSLTDGAEDKESNLYEDEYVDSPIFALKEPFPEGIPTVDELLNEEPPEPASDTFKAFHINSEGK